MQLTTTKKLYKVIGAVLWLIIQREIKFSWENGIGFLNMQHLNWPRWIFTGKDRIECFFQLGKISREMTWEPVSIRYLLKVKISPVWCIRYMRGRVEIRLVMELNMLHSAMIEWMLLTLALFPPLTLTTSVI